MRRADGAPKSIKGALRRLDVRPSKRRGQNFVIEDSVIRTILEFGQPMQGERLVEIGPGLGALTRGLSAFPGLVVIEIEQRFCAELKLAYPDITVIEADVRSVDLSAIGNDLVIFGNLPYSLSTEIISLLLNQATTLRRAVLMLQREFVERLAAQPGGRDYGAISLGCRLWADIMAGPIIPGDAFHPPAAVESRLIELRFLKSPRMEVADTAAFRRVVKAAFMKRRKKVINSMKSSGYYPIEPLTRALAEAEIDPGRRAETLSFEEFVRLYRALEQFSKIMSR